MSKIIEFLKPYTGMVFLIAVLLFIESMCALALPGYMADIVNDGILPGNINLIWRTGGIMILVTLLNVFTHLTVGYFSAKTSTGVGHDLREAVFGKVLKFSNAEMDRFTSSSLITRTTNDITQVQGTLMMSLRLLIFAPMMGIGGILKALERSHSMTWIIGLAVVCVICMMLIMFTVVRPKFKIIQGLVDRLNQVTRENLSGILITRAFSTQNFEKKRFDKANKDLAETHLFVDQAMAVMFPIINLVMSLTTTLIIWVGARQVSAFRIGVGDIFAFLQYGMQIIFAFMMISMMFIMLPRAVVSAGRIKEVLETIGSITFRKDPLKFHDFKGIVEFRNVSFIYPEESPDIAVTGSEKKDSILDDISFIAKPGQTTAIIGSTGAGKTTILNLLLRFYDVSGGAIYIDGIDIRDLSKEDLHDKIGYISQKALLFSGSVRTNLNFADKNATDDRIHNAAEIAQAKGFINEKPEGYEANVAQGGSNFSGGQKQRLSIARALVKNAPIYLFDDSFSALDLKTDALLRAALKKNTGGSTMLIVAQRISTIMDADQILVLEHGKIAGRGTHAELLDNCAVYREIAASQLTGEEMEK